MWTIASRVANKGHRIDVTHIKLVTDRGKYIKFLAHTQKLTDFLNRWVPDVDIEFNTKIQIRIDEFLLGSTGIYIGSIGVYRDGTRLRDATMNDELFAFIEKKLPNILLACKQEDVEE